MTAPVRFHHWVGPVRAGGLLAVLALCGVLALAIGPGSAAASDDVENVTVYRAANTTLPTADAIQAAIANDTIEPADKLVVGDTLVVAIESERLADTMAAANGSTTERFFDALDGDTEFRIAQTDVDTHSPPKVAPIGRENVTVHRAGTTVYVLVETGELGIRYAHRDQHKFGPAHLFGGEHFAVQFGYHLDDLPLEGSPRPISPSTPQFELYFVKSTFHLLHYPSWNGYEALPPAVIKLPVVVNIPPEETLVVRLSLDTNRTLTTPVLPRIESELPAVLDIPVDLRCVDPGTGYTLELVRDGTVVDRYKGAVRTRATSPAGRDSPERIECVPTSTSTATQPPPESLAPVFDQFRTVINDLLRG